MPNPISAPRVPRGQTGPPCRAALGAKSMPHDRGSALPGRYLPALWSGGLRDGRGDGSCRMNLPSSVKTHLGSGTCLVELLVIASLWNRADAINGSLVIVHQFTQKQGSYPKIGRRRKCFPANPRDCPLPPARVDKLPLQQNLPGVGFILTRKNKTIYNKGCGMRKPCWPSSRLPCWPVCNPSTATPSLPAAQAHEFLALQLGSAQKG